MARIWIAFSGPTLLFSLIGAVAWPVQAEELEDFVAAKAGALELLHRKAERSLVGVAQDPSYGEYFAEHTHDQRDHLKERIDQISLEAQQKFDVGEMCLIDEHGHEVSRIVEGEVAHDLSTEEARAIFFQPGFELPPKQVYVSPIYMSPDVNRWVVAYVTPIAVGRENKAILHYEHDLAFYQQLLADGLATGDRALLAINEDGWIVADSRSNIRTEQHGGSAEPAEYFEQISDDEGGYGALAEKLASGESGTGTVILNDAPHHLAWRTVKRWTVVGLEPEAG